MLSHELSTEPYVVTFNYSETEYLMDILSKVRDLIDATTSDVPGELDDLIDALDKADTIEFVDDEEVE